MKTDYVLGFVFDPDHQRVVLVQKAKPDWQKGKLNGPGGKVEPTEAPADAVRREVREETGLDIPIEDWKFFLILEGSDFKVLCFKAVVPLARVLEVKSTNITMDGLSEAVIPVSVDYALEYAPVIPNLKWIIPLAMDSDRIITEAQYMER